MELLPDNLEYILPNLIVFLYTEIHYKSPYIPSQYYNK